MWRLITLSGCLIGLALGRPLWCISRHSLGAFSGTSLNDARHTSRALLSPWFTCAVTPVAPHNHSNPVGAVTSSPVKTRDTTGVRTRKRITTSENVLSSISRPCRVHLTWGGRSLLSRTSLLLRAGRLKMGSLYWRKITPQGLSVRTLGNEYSCQSRHNAGR
jgi:hypothetical protein